ncbi:MAG: hypothetical protein QOJ54_867 [Aliidongia sp.]|nr:hypothetical protein [Aliidongia sp.]
MSNAKIQLRLPEDMKAAATRQAAMSGISLNLFIATAIAARVGAQAEAERYFAARGARTTPARAKALLIRLGTPGAVRDLDRVDGVGRRGRRSGCGADHWTLPTGKAIFTP